MLSISTLPEALAELDKQTGRVWTDSELFDLVTKYSIELHAAPPITAQTTNQKFVIGVGMVETFRSQPGHARLAVLFPWQVGQIWLSGETLASHTERHNETEGEVKWFTEPVRVTREQVRIKAETLQIVLMVWRKKRPTVDAMETAPAQTTTPAPVVEELDYSLLATPAELLDAFGKWGMDAAWFDDLNSRQWLLDARRRKGQGQRGHVIEPLFCPFAVMNGLIGKVRKAKRLQPDTAWRTLEHKFPKVHATFESHDPREQTGD